MRGSNHLLLSLGQELQMQFICLLEENEKEWETENQEVQEIPPLPFFLFILKGLSCLFSWSVLGYILLACGCVLL